MTWISYEVLRHSDRTTKSIETVESLVVVISNGIGLFPERIKHPHTHTDESSVRFDCVYCFSQPCAYGTVCRGDGGNGGDDSSMAVVGPGWRFRHPPIMMMVCSLRNGRGTYHDATTKRFACSNHFASASMVFCVIDTCRVNGYRNNSRPLVRYRSKTNAVPLVYRSLSTMLLCTEN